MNEQKINFWKHEITYFTHRMENLELASDVLTTDQLNNRRAFYKKEIATAKRQLRFWETR